MIFKSVRHVLIFQDVYFSFDRKFELSSSRVKINTVKKTSGFNDLDCISGRVNFSAWFSLTNHTY